MEPGDEPITNYEYLKALADHAIPLAAMPDPETAKRIREWAGISRQLAGTILGCGSNTILRFEASQVQRSHFLEGSEGYRRLLAALMLYLSRTDESKAEVIRRHWKPLEPKTNNDRVEVA